MHKLFKITNRNCRTIRLIRNTSDTSGLDKCRKSKFNSTIKHSYSPKWRFSIKRVKTSYNRQQTRALIYYYTVRR